MSGAVFDAPGDVAHVLHLAALEVEHMWCRPSGADLMLGLIDEREPWRGVGDDLPVESLTLCGALHRVTGLEVLAVPDLSRAEWRPLWDAITLALARHTGVWEHPRTGADAISSVLAWERTVATEDDVSSVLTLAAELAAQRATSVECPACACDPRPGETARGEPCPTCDGAERLSLHPHRWTLRLVRTEETCR